MIDVSFAEYKAAKKRIYQKEYRQRKRDQEQERLANVAYHLMKNTTDEDRQFAKSLDSDIEFSEGQKFDEAAFMRQVRHDMLGDGIVEHMKIRGFGSFNKVKVKNKSAFESIVEKPAESSAESSPTSHPFHPWIKLTRRPHALVSSRPDVYSFLDHDLSYKAMDALLEYLGERYPPERWFFVEKEDESMLEDELWLKRILKNTVNDLDEYTCTAEEGCDGRVIMMRRKGDRLLYAYCYEHIPVDESEEPQDAGEVS